MHADTCLAEHARVTCHQAIRTSCHEHNAHAPGWHAANWVQGSPSALACEHMHRGTDKGAQDHVHSKDEAACTLALHKHGRLHAKQAQACLICLPCRGDGTT